MEFSSISRSARTFGSKIGESYGFPFIFEKERIFNDCVRALFLKRKESLVIVSEHPMVTSLKVCT